MTRFYPSHFRKWGSSLKEPKKAHPPKREMSLAKLWCFEKTMCLIYF